MEFFFAVMRRKKRTNYTEARNESADQKTPRFRCVKYVTFVHPPVFVTVDVVYPIASSP
jgi:hypothetical protein